MINALEMVRMVVESAGDPEPSTLEGSSVILTTKKALKWVNFVGQSLGHHYFWKWLQRVHTVITVPEYITGTVDVTQGSATVVGSAVPTDTAWTEDMVGRVFMTKSYAEHYKIIAVPDKNTLTLEHAYNGDSILLSGYTIFKTRYPLPGDFDRELDLFSFIAPGRVDWLTFNELQQGKRIPYSTLSFFGKREASIVGVEDGKSILEFANIFDKTIQIPVSYYSVVPKFVQDIDVWDFPPFVESVLHDAALRYIHSVDKDDRRGEGFDLQSFFQGRQELIGLTPTQPRPRVIPDAGRRRLDRLKRRLGTRSVEYGEYFDRDLV